MGTISRKEYFRRNNYTVLIWFMLCLAMVLSIGLISSVFITADKELASRHSQGAWLSVGFVWLVPVIIRIAGNIAYDRYVKVVKNQN